jgi:glycosyltransferase involved in cell wall biosynthesis
MPTKIGEFLACGRPVVVNKGLGDMDQFIAEYDAGVVLDGDLQNLAESAHKLISLITDPDTPNRCRALAEKHFSMDTGVENYLDLYSQILNSKN